tara:strand:+ start:131 stop:469 length:339 start_codon:yes stop_codon:yes gene_type:complete
MNEEIKNEVLDIAQNWASNAIHFCEGAIGPEDYLGTIIEVLDNYMWPDERGYGDETTFQNCLEKLEKKHGEFNGKVRAIADKEFNRCVNKWGKESGLWKYKNWQSLRHIAAP